MVANSMDHLRNKENEKMREWLLTQFEHFNVLMLCVIFIFTTVLSKANLQKQLKMQSEEFYKWHEELKDEIRGNCKK